ncbi:MAG: zinc ribbon domain-containing protein [Calditrichaeota bacterium]|nr:MAG: zinc ribbon domain-containing protein [Calditrichota bacterium]
MPNYQYKCSHCQHEFERFFSISNYQQEVECPSCGNTARLTISGGMGLIFKGSGFYITDYKGKNNSTGSNGKKSDVSKSETSKSTSSTEASSDK